MPSKDFVDQFQHDHLMHGILKDLLGDVVRGDPRDGGCCNNPRPVVEYRDDQYGQTIEVTVCEACGTESYAM